MVEVATDLIHPVHGLTRILDITFAPELSGLLKPDEIISGKHCSRSASPDGSSWLTS